MQENFYVTVTGKKVIRITKEELQLLEFQIGCIPDDDLEFFLSEYKRLMQVVADKYGEMTNWDVDQQYKSVKRKSVWKLINIPPKEQFALAAQIDAIPRENIDHFRSEFDKIVQGIAEKYGLIPKN